ncbi:MAG: AmmeMemoRadiSam system radical SAM enzyme [Acidobacteriota bacterium]
MPLRRREFIRRACAAGAGICLACARPFARPAVAEAAGREARYYRRLSGGRVHCYLCPCNPSMQACGVLEDGETCWCHVRTNRAGRLYVTNYARLAAIHIDPVEKSPLYHVMPGAKVMAVAAPGCSLACICCQNWEMSQVGVDDLETIEASPSEIVDRAVQTRSTGIAFTYTEPVVYFEYVVDTAAIARKRGLRVLVSTGGYITTEPLRELCRYVDAFSVSVKGFSEKFYLDNCRGSFKVVLESLRTIREEGVWLEIPVLIIPGLSDRIQDVSWFCGWVRDNLGTEVPVHFIRFSPAYRLQNLSPTPVRVLEAARTAATRAGLRYAYIGNVPGHDANNTNCPSCGRLLIQRLGFQTIGNALVPARNAGSPQHDSCPACGQQIPGLWR